MPLKLIPPREGKTPYWSARGTYLGRYLDRSTKTRKRTVAAKIVRAWEREIEEGSYASAREPTFASAALAYMRAGGERRFLRPIILHFGEMPLSKIGQEEIDAAAEAIYPRRSPATVNRQLYSPISAVLRRANVSLALHRPKGSAGRRLTGWLKPEEAESLFAEARKLDSEFVILLMLLCYTGLRLGEALRIQISSLRLEENFLLIEKTKNEEPRPVHIPPRVVAALRALTAGLNRSDSRLFRFHKSGHLYSLLYASAAHANVTLPERQAFHLFRHTYATWMRRYANLDTRGLVGTGAWRDRKSAERYEHVVATEESKRANKLPGAKPKRRKRRQN